MLAIIAAILLIMWVLGMGTAHAFGGLIHILLVVAIIAVVLHVVQGRKA